MGNKLGLAKFAFTVAAISTLLLMQLSWIVEDFTKSKTIPGPRLINPLGQKTINPFIVSNFMDKLGKFPLFSIKIIFLTYFFIFRYESIS